MHLDEPLQFRDVDIGGDTLPLYISGQMEDNGTTPVGIAVVVNGVVVATTQSYQEHDNWVFATMIPENALVPGGNDVRVFVVESTDDGEVLTLAAPGSS